MIYFILGQDVNEFWEIEDPWSMLTEMISKTGGVLEPRLIGEVAKNTLLACYRVGLYLDKKMMSAGMFSKINLLSLNILIIRCRTGINLSIIFC